MEGALDTYDRQAPVFAAQYESIASADVHAPLIEFVPTGGQDRIALDIGAGSGRDAAWLASLGYAVVAVEPAAGMRSEGQRLHPDSGIRWLDDRLPDLGEVLRLGLAFDLVLLSAVWMHVPPPARTRAFRKVATLLKPGGTLLITLRDDGRGDAERPMWPAPAGEIEALARVHGLAVLRLAETGDALGRTGVRWTHLCLRLPDDGAGALPLIRGIILNDDKSSTYKLGLLRAVARVADAAPGLVESVGNDDAVAVPLGAVALNWVRMYLPLILAGYPQAPGNTGPDGLGFAKTGFRALMAANFVGQDLRLGARFTGERADAVFRALTEAARTIADMPANYIRFPSSDARVFQAQRLSGLRPRGELTIDRELLASFGTLLVPGHIWRTLQRLGSWVDPVLVSEWARLARAYADRMGLTFGPGVVEGALAWLDPVRDTQFARAAAKRLFDAGKAVNCVWTGVRLSKESIDIDHCLPWSAWPCGDLWNLLPASPRVNQHLKRERLPSASALASARIQIIAWWEDAWLSDDAVGLRFEREAMAALPIGTERSPDDIFAALEWRRLRLRQDQQVQEWEGVARAERPLPVNP